jgi:hypothetical protein
VIIAARNNRPNGIVLYDGPSMLDGQPIVVIATGLRDRSLNVKTGAMIQTWIIRSDVHPLEARRTGADYSICGTCPFRDGRCYVQIGQAPAAIYHAYHRGLYPRGTAADLAGRAVRFGAYGDPAAAPVALWRSIASVASSRTGYTHSWKRRPALRGLVMASCESPEDAARARSLGWGVFRVLSPSEQKSRGEATCLAVAAGKQCADCTLCDGRALSVVIPAHGGLATMSKWRALEV